MKTVILLTIACALACANCAGPTPEPPNTAVTPVAQDLEQAVQQATQAYIDAKNGDTSWAWSVQKALDAYGLIVKTKDDVKQVLRQWSDGTQAGKSFAQKLADLFAQYKAAPAQKTALMSRAVTKAAVHYTVPKRALTSQEKAEIFKAASAAALACGNCDAEREIGKLTDRARYHYRVQWRVVSPIVQAGWNEAIKTKSP